MFIRRTENNWLTKWWLGVDKTVLFSVFDWGIVSNKERFIVSYLELRAGFK